jgi:hypothetical protein
LDEGIGLDVFCQCGHNGYLSVEQARERLDPASDFTEAAFKLRCVACGAKGGPKVSVRFSIGDYYDLCDAQRAARL